MYQNIKKVYPDIMDMKTEEVFNLLDKDLQDHSKRVAELSIKIAKELDEDINELSLYKAALYHDIGKIMIPEHILNKPAKLTKEEMDIVKTHAKYSAQILSRNNEDKEVIKAVLYHHENYDGSGYPMGLVGDNIPCMARILRVVDTFDALHSSRVYKEAMIVDQCIRELDKVIINYDKEIRDKFIKILLNQLIYNK